MTQPESESSDKLPKHTTPTWEVELLISGIAVFAMLQLPGWLSDRSLYLLPRFGASWHISLILVFAYSIGAAMILAATFALHLLMRAYWIALVGMHSVYPDGICWDRLRMGPIEREVMQRRDGDFAAMIDRADNRASIVFAVGVVLAVILLVVAVLVVGLFAAGTATVAALQWHVLPETILLVATAIVVIPVLLIRMLDRRLGTRLREGNPVRRVVAAGSDLYAKIGFANSGGVLGVLSSHHGRWRVRAITFAVIVACILGAVFGQQAMRMPERVGSYAWFPHFDKSSVSVIDAAHYDNQRDPLRDGAVPFVQSAEIEGNHVRLVVPFRPDRDAAVLQRACPAALAITDADTRAGTMLRCLAALHPVILDGKVLAGLHYDAGSDARTERPALVAMIDIRALAPGRHELAIAQPPGVSDDGKSEAPTPWLIPFWR